MLKAGDEIKIGCTSENDFTSIKKLPIELIPLYNNDNIVRVILGPQDDYFTKNGINTFLDCEYKVTSGADRMGYRLSGPKIDHKGSADIISDGITMGSVQIPGDGAPIIMMADRQTTGGYTKIATIITPDINIVGQLKPGDSVRFKLIGIEEAHRIYRKYMKNFDSIRNNLAKSGCTTPPGEKFKVRVNNKEYEVIVQEIK